MADLSQQPRVYLPWWTWLTFLVPVAFLALCGWMLFLAQNSRREDSGRALATGKLEQLERSLLQLQRGSVVLWRTAVASDSVERWRELYRNYRNQVKQLDGTDPAIQEVMDHLQRIYAAVGRSEQIRHQLLTTTMAEPEARALETEFRSKLDVALAEVKSAMAKLRGADPAADKQALWTGFAIASAGLALITLLLLYLLGRQYGRLASYEVHVSGSLAAAQTVQARCQAILNATPDALLLLGENGQIEAANLGVQSLTGYPVAELAGRSLSEVFPSLAGGAGRPEPAGQGTWLAMEVRRRDGISQTLDVLFRRTSVDGVTGALVILRPPGKGRVEEQLRTQRDFLNSVLETADIMLAVLDERGRITNINGALERKTGLMLAQLKGQPFLSTFALEPIAGKVVRFPAPSGLCWVSREEERRRILWHGTELLGRGGAIKNVVVAGVDLTDFLPALTAQPELSDKSLAEERSRLAVRVAQTLSDSLTAVSGYAELLLDSLGPADTARADAEQILEAGRRAETVTRSMLSFARCDILRPQTIDINMRIEALKPRLSAAAGANVQLIADLDRTLDMVEIDPERLDELLLILVRNAGESMPGGGKVVLRTANTRVTDGAMRVSVSVEDTGTGITPETKRRLFEPFFTTKDPRRALGLGLATARGIVAQSGGSIRIDTTPGAGTSVSVLLPPAAIPAPRPPATAAAGARQA